MTISPNSTMADTVVDAVIANVKEVAKERAISITAETNVLELGLDSVERMDIISQLEQSFSIRVPDSLLPEIETCQEIADAIEEVLEQQGNATDTPLEYYDLEHLPEWKQLQQMINTVEATGESNPFFAVHESASTNKTTVAGKELINFSGFNYLGMSGNPEVTAAAKSALDAYGTSASASRLVAGTRPVHVELENILADFTRNEAAATFVSGYMTNNIVIGHLMGPGDLIVHDELAHNSIVMGSILSGAERRAFPHNNIDALNDILSNLRGQYRKVLIVVEGVYSMDGDFSDVPALIEIKHRHQTLLMVDEAHSIGTMGVNGRGMAEHYGIDTVDVDIWMGTLGKALGAGGGYIAGRSHFIQYMKHTCPGMIFSIGLSPCSAEAALKSVQLLLEQPDRVATLQSRAAFFLTLLKQRGVNTGDSNGTPIVPVILGNSLHAIQSSRMMHERGVSVQPILHPAVAEESARLRFFLNALHTNEELSVAAKELVAVLKELDPAYLQP
ncbi:MAG: aminotransferase class I/II-fold pyridoxal phosphate-dependent enzyme [Pirellulaceae bacterium]|nr:aminotransferase class I/II-fold pyridoxal phosphate-dependent enzyme [Pirellulaceae bacterium]